MESVSRKSATIGFLLVAFGAACSADTAFSPGRDVVVTTDSTVYHLQPMPPSQPAPVWYEINLTVTVVNKSEHDVFLRRDCGNWRLARADENDRTELFLGEYGCALASSPPQPPLAIAAGDKYTQTFRITGSNSPLTRPPITIENNTGLLVFEYAFTDPAGKARASVRSQPIRVVPPA